MNWCFLVASAQYPGCAGDSMSISRKHASIMYNFEARRFELHVMGKNGVSKDGELVTPEKAPVSLHSGVPLAT